jgi:hypothetical protein
MLSNACTAPSVEDEIPIHFSFRNKARRIAI